MRRYAVESARFLDAGAFYAAKIARFLMGTLCEGEPSKTVLFLKHRRVLCEKAVENALFLHIAAKEQSHFFHFTHFRPARGFRFPVNTGSRQAGLQPFARLFPDGEG
ncbi:hypothetical protein BF29_3280 [Heyndrickxia coagulans DSM 1 = ATCC 7050]|uniref:Uncharacterized protein n=1 Tax=Heyndrickxia coagulans DSM 1 = ATCC 7050 TaxID=1121088 RepID=A0A8B4BRM3_HEYCO|nr:hypothetical protein BF29_3280 [Heyndrickxia coagulans DSM 1 = ATCC 7050]SHE56497.1 hypothetical protein SAMN02745208_00545 [Heyndrickxia coagulans DSM 1 = ATCC 7050]